MKSIYPYLGTANDKERQHWHMEVLMRSHRRSKGPDMSLQPVRVVQWIACTYIQQADMLKQSKAGPPPLPFI